jgi:hypothetical protein
MYLNFLKLDLLEFMSAAIESHFLLDVSFVHKATEMIETACGDNVARHNEEDSTFSTASFKVHSLGDESSCEFDAYILSNNCDCYHILKSNKNDLQLLIHLVQRRIASPPRSDHSLLLLLQRQKLRCPDPTNSFTILTLNYSMNVVANDGFNKITQI